MLFRRILMTALMAAAYHGREEICRALLSRGADPRMQDKRGHDAAAVALRKEGLDDPKRRGLAVPSRCARRLGNGIACAGRFSLGSRLPQ